MDKFGKIEIRITGNKGNLDLSPENYDIKEISAILQNIENLLYPTNKKDRPIITYNIQEGSVLHIFKTKFLRTENIWADAELYFYGTLTNAGGKNKANVHLDTDEYGSIIIDTKKEFLQGQEENLLYKKLGIRVIGKQNAETGEIDKNTLRLIELIDYNPKYDDNYLNSLISKAKKNWTGINPDDWLNNLRGGYEA